MNPTLSAALNYASQGVKVMPLHYIMENGICSCGGKDRNPNCKAGKHPYGKLVPNGLKDATSDCAILEKWFADGRLNLGIVTGSDSGIFVIDQDDRDGGHISIQELEKKHGSLPMTLVQRTGNGLHYLFKMPLGVDVKNSQKLVGIGIDVRGSGGYICAAPSKHESGCHYEWIGTEEFDRSLIAEAPSWLIQLATANQNKKPALVVDNNDLIHAPVFSIPEKISDGEGRESFILKYAGHLRGKGLEQTTIEQILLDYDQGHIDPPLGEVVVLDRARRFETQAIHSGTVRLNRTIGYGGRDEPTKLEDETHGDIANGRLFASIHRGKLKYVFAAKKWLKWDGQRWGWCESGEHLEAAKLVADKMLDLATANLKANPNDPESKRQMAHAIKSRDERRLHSMIALAQSEPNMAVGNMGQLDSDPWLLNVENGVVDLKTGSLIDHDPRMLQTKICNALFLRGALCPKWEKFLDEIFCGDTDLIDYVQRALGYSMTGLVTEEVMFFMFGFGANGKSVFINTVSNILSDYAMTAPASMLALRRNDDKGRATPEMARMVGSRFAVANETQSNDRLDEQLVKVLVSRENIAARPLYGDYVDLRVKVTRDLHLNLTHPI